MTAKDSKLQDTEHDKLVPVRTLLGGHSLETLPFEKLDMSNLVGSFRSLKVTLLPKNKSK